MTPIEQIYAASEPYWQTREGHIHVPCVYAFAQQLLTFYPQADPEIVLPAILMHDNGYMLVPEETHSQGLAGSPIGWKPDITRLHEEAGVKLAGEILGQLHYDPEKTRQIQAIIDGHDSTQAAHSLEDALVKDADKLWRFTTAGVQMACRLMKYDQQGYLAFAETRIEPWFCTHEAKQIARAELAKARRELGQLNS